MKKNEIIMRLIGHKTCVKVYYNNTESEAIISWNTEEECRNFNNFMQSDLGSLFMNYCLFNISMGYSIPVEAIMHLVITAVLPKVDWTRSWTVKEILADFDYTNNEIEEMIFRINSNGPWLFSENCIKATYTINMGLLEKAVKTMAYNENMVA